MGTGTEFRPAPREIVPLTGRIGDVRATVAAAERRILVSAARREER